MHKFLIPNLTCGHCASKVNVALKFIDPSCEIQVDIPSHIVNVKSDEDRDTLVDALTDAGYPPL